jgi:hypothetical protein
MNSFGLIPDETVTVARPSQTNMAIVDRDGNSFRPEHEPGRLSASGNRRGVRGRSRRPGKRSEHSTLTHTRPLLQP